MPPPGVQGTDRLACPRWDALWDGRGSEPYAGADSPTAAAPPPPPAPSRRDSPCAHPPSPTPAGKRSLSHHIPLFQLGNHPWDIPAAWGFRAAELAASSPGTL